MSRRSQMATASRTAAIALIAAAAVLTISKAALIPTQAVSASKANTFVISEDVVFVPETESESESDQFSSDDSKAAAEAEDDTLMQAQAENDFVAAQIINAMKIGDDEQDERQGNSANGDAEADNQFETEAEAQNGDETESVEDFASPINRLRQAISEAQSQNEDSNEEDQDSSEQQADAEAIAHSLNELDDSNAEQSAVARAVAPQESPLRSWLNSFQGSPSSDVTAYTDAATTLQADQDGDMTDRLQSSIVEEEHQHKKRLAAESTPTPTPTPGSGAKAAATSDAAKSAASSEQAHAQAQPSSRMIPLDYAAIVIGCVAGFLMTLFIFGVCLFWSRRSMRKHAESAASQGHELDQRQLAGITSV